MRDCGACLSSLERQLQAALQALVKLIDIVLPEASGLHRAFRWFIYMLKASMNATSTLPFRFVHGRTFVHPRATFSAGVEGKRLPAVGWKGFRPCQCFDIGSGAWGNRPWAPRRILAPP